MDEENLKRDLSIHKIKNHEVFTIMHSSQFILARAEFVLCLKSIVIISIIEINLL